jgi:hypothetical protein
LWKAGHLGLFATVRASQALQNQLHTKFLTLLTPDKWGVFDGGILESRLIRLIERIQLVRVAQFVQSS